MPWFIYKPSLRVSQNLSEIRFRTSATLRVESTICIPSRKQDFLWGVKRRPISPPFHFRFTITKGVNSYSSMNISYVSLDVSRTLPISNPPTRSPFVRMKNRCASYNFEVRSREYPLHLPYRRHTGIFFPSVGNVFLVLSSFFPTLFLSLLASSARFFQLDNHLQPSVNTHCPFLRWKLTEYNVNPLSTPLPFVYLLCVVMRIPSLRGALCN